MKESENYMQNSLLYPKFGMLEKLLQVPVFFLKQAGATKTS